MTVKFTIRGVPEIVAFLKELPRGSRIVVLREVVQYLIGNEHHGLKHEPAYKFVSLPEATGIRKACDHLKEGRCAIHALKSMQMATLCLAWPIIPEHVELLDQCSYTFQEINRWPIPEEVRRKP